MKRASSINPPILLKTILDIAFWVLIFGLFGAIIFTVASVFYEIPLDLRVNEYEITDLTAPIIFGIICKFIILGLFIYIVYLLRKVVRSFYKNKLFTPFQINGIRLIGRLIIITTLADIILDFLLKLFLESKAHIQVNLDTSFDSFWFTLALGLFFILLSKAFENARLLKEENDLTV